MSRICDAVAVALALASSPVPLPSNGPWLAADGSAVVRTQNYNGTSAVFQARYTSTLVTSSPSGYQLTTGAAVVAGAGENAISPEAAAIEGLLARPMLPGNLLDHNLDGVLDAGDLM